MITINLIAILKFIGWMSLWFVVIPTVLNIALILLAVVTRAYQYVLQGTYDELTWFICIPASWLGTFFISMFFLAGLFEIVRYNLLGGKQKEEEQERKRLIAIKNKMERDRRNKEEYDRMMQPHIEKFNRICHETAKYLKETKGEKV
jgi:hypothetical protein